MAVPVPQEDLWCRRACPTLYTDIGNWLATCSGLRPSDSSIPRAVKRFERDGLTGQIDRYEDAAATPSLRKAGTASPGSLLSPGCSMTFPDSVPAGHDHEAANAEAGAYRPCRRSQRRGTAGGDAAEGVPTIGPAAARLLSGPRYLHAAVQQRDQESSSNPFAPSSLVLSDRASVKVEELSKRDAISEEDFQILYGTLP
jgi:hypothetical protein